MASWWCWLTFLPQVLIIGKFCDVRGLILTRSFTCLGYDTASSSFFKDPAWLARTCFIEWELYYKFRLKLRSVFVVNFSQHKLFSEVSLKLTLLYCCSKHGLNLDVFIREHELNLSPVYTDPHVYTEKREGEEECHFLLRRWPAHLRRGMSSNVSLTDCCLS